MKTKTLKTGSYMKSSSVFGYIMKKNERDYPYENLYGMEIHDGPDGDYLATKDLKLKMTGSDFRAMECEVVTYMI